MLRMMVVDESHERRAALVDALCELPGVEVSAAAADVSSAVRHFERARFDAVVGACDLPGASAVTLIDAARRCGPQEIILWAERRMVLPEIAEYWRELGASEVIGTIPALVACARSLAERRRSGAPAMCERAAPVSVARTCAIIGAALRPPRPAEPVSAAAALREAMLRWGGLIPPEVQLRLEVERDAPRVRCLERHIEAIALQLVLDACDAIPLGGHVWLCVERAPDGRLRITVLESSGRRRTSGRLSLIRAIVRSYAGELREIELGSGAISVEVTLPAVATMPS
jgi:CheY-like chemotaxis protein